jgi:pyridoxal phosphate-dependent aminotransferase EpsN
VDTLTCEYQLPGGNFKCSDILAAVALVQLSQAGEKIRRVREIYARYEEAIGELPHLKMLSVKVLAGELPLYVVALCPRRAELVRFLAAEGIQTRKLPPDLAQAPYLTPPAPLRQTPYASQGLVLPCGPDQPLENVDMVIDALRRFGNVAGDGEAGLSLYELPGVGPSLPVAIS